MAIRTVVNMLCLSAVGLGNVPTPLARKKQFISGPENKKENMVCSFLDAS